MTTRNEARAKCIEAAAKAHYEAKKHINVTHRIPTWEELGPVSRNYRLKLMTAAFDSLNGIATVNLPEATEEMLAASASALFAKLEGVSRERCAMLVQFIFAAMSTVGNLTNPPEKKP